MFKIINGVIYQGNRTVVTTHDLADLLGIEPGKVYILLDIISKNRKLSNFDLAKKWRKDFLLVSDDDPEYMAQSVADLLGVEVVYFDKSHYKIDQLLFNHVTGSWRFVR